MGVIILLPEYLYFSPSHLTLLNIIKIKVLKKKITLSLWILYTTCVVSRPAPLKNATTHHWAGVTEKCHLSRCCWKGQVTRDDLCFAFLFVSPCKGNYFGGKSQELVENILEAVNQPDYIYWHYSKLYRFSEVKSY